MRPAYEDPLSKLAAKARLPQGDAVEPGADLDPEAGRDTAEARAELLARLDESTSTPTAFVLPLHRRDDEVGWASTNWRLRRGRIVLVDGDSPAGLRLPLNAISWKPPRASFDTDPTTVGDELHPSAVEALVDDDESAPTTAMVVEARDGLLYVFLPPTGALDHFVDLIARIHAAAKKIGSPVVIEGYEPPADPRLTSTTITPDPGVIEVNVAPTASFAEQTRQLETLYEQARLARLSTESFAVDGSHGGTGGGNHITLGGVTPKNSPLLRRPDLLVSLLTYWQRHPSLSYLFAGRFVGTTSQAPRVDEGRAEALYELEIAFAEIDRLASSSGAGTPRPWIIDRALRHLLTDITGNTHRAEFCIDKLYNPYSMRGRLGLLELRGFEMPPHLRMAMVQSLLVRSLVAWFWDEPLRAPLIRHGANLHGRYLLPHFLIHDIADVAADLRAHGIAFDTSWLDPFTEFRFPRIGTAVFDGVEIELRGAIEPWNTLGEEATAAGTARYVDSSVERIQVRIIGADRHRYLVTCNGYPVPLLATDNPDVHVGGVRFRAWQPPSALHPSITVDGPLQFELIDLTSSTSRGGCTYHIAHPGGRAYDVPPVNAVEAESRRARRFEATGFTPGKLDALRHSRDAGANFHRRRRAGHPRSAARAYRPAVMALVDMAVHPSDPAAFHDRTDVDRLLAGYRTARAQETLFDLRPPSLQGPVIGYDEFLDETGRVRPAWADLADAVGDRGRAGMSRLGSAVRQLVNNDDISYTVVDPAKRIHRPAVMVSRGHGVSTRYRWWCRLLIGTYSRPGWCNAPGFSTPCWPTCTAADARSPKAYCHRSCCSPIPAMCAPPTGSKCPGTISSSCTPATSADSPTAASR